MKLRIFDGARSDLLEGFEFYERQEPGVGRHFLDSLYADIDLLQLYAGIHPVKAGGFHWMLSKRFPYAIYYTLEDQVVSVFAVLDCRQNPENIEQRLRDVRVRRWGG